MKLHTGIFICLQLILQTGLRAQVIESNSRRELNFVFEVKQIDEFFERFNKADNSLFVTYIGEKYPDVLLERASMIKSLFNNQDSLGQNLLRQEFCRQVADSSRPFYLDFYGNDWYSEARCKFLYRNRPIEVSIFLKIEKTQNGGSKWMICGARSKQIEGYRPEIVFPSRQSQGKFLNPMSHATNFIGLSRAFRDQQDIPDYLDTNFLQGSSSKGFVKALLNGELKYQHVKEIRYHFLQVEGWIFTVKQYRRESIHSGWLISQLVRADDRGKKIYRSWLFARGS